MFCLVLGLFRLIPLEFIHSFCGSFSSILERFQVERVNLYWRCNLLGILNLSVNRIITMPCVTAWILNFT